MGIVIAGRHDDFAAAYTRCGNPGSHARHLDEVARVAHQRRLHLLVAEAGTLKGECPCHSAEVVRFKPFCVSTNKTND